MVSLSRLAGLFIVALYFGGCSNNKPAAATTDPVATNGGAALAPSPSSSSTATIALQGVPSTIAIVGSEYSFQPIVSSASKVISFTVTGLPAWLTFDADSGALSGTPSANNEGSTGHITITASSGSASASTTPFVIQVRPADPSATRSVQLSWAAPTENTDGTPITDLAGYHIYYGTNPGDLTRTIDIVGGTSTTFVVAGLTAGTYYFSVLAYNSAGVDSGQSNVANETI